MIIIIDAPPTVAPPAVAPSSSSNSSISITGPPMSLYERITLNASLQFSSSSTTAGAGKATKGKATSGKLTRPPRAVKKDKIEHMFQSDFGDRPASTPTTTASSTCNTTNSAINSSAMVCDDDEGEGDCDTQDSTALPFSKSQQSQQTLSQQSIPTTAPTTATTPPTTAPTSSSGVLGGAKRRKLSQYMYKLLMSKDPNEKLD